MAVPRESKEKGRKIPSGSRPTVKINKSPGPHPRLFGFLRGGHCWARTSDLYNVNVAL